MKIKCEYCDSMFDDTLEKCPSCGAPNKNVRRSTSDQPTTIEGLKEWYVSKGLPDEEVTRFFIGKDYRGAKAFGIYKDENSGNFVVYKNKADGTRAVRYEGTDEAYAVNEIHTRLKQEILEQKANNIKNSSTSSSSSSYRPSQGGRKRKKGCLSTLITYIITIGIIGGGVGYVYTRNLPPAVGYYKCDDISYYKGKLLYHYDDDEYSWALYDTEKGDWVKNGGSTEINRQYKAKKYFLSSDYNSSYGGTDFADSLLYSDAQNNFKVNTGYYAYDDNIYYHMKSGQDDGWYIYDTETDDWDDVWFTDVPSDLKHQSVAEDFWYTPTWDSETQITDFAETEYYSDYQDELAREAAYEASHSSYDDDDDDDYSWSSSDDSWDSGSSDWDSDW